jgi:predicted acyl esterase
MTAADAGREEFLPPTALESSLHALGADTVRYRFDYVMLPMRDGVRLATVVIRPRAEGRFPTLLVRTPYAVTSIPDQAKPMHTAQFKKNYVLIVQNERGSEWSEGDFGFLTRTTADAQDTLDWISAQEWSNGKVGLHGCSSTAENQLKLGAIGHPALYACVPMSSGAGIGDIPGAEGSNGCFSAVAFPCSRSGRSGMRRSGSGCAPSCP